MKQKTFFYYLKPVGKGKFESRRVDVEKHPLLAFFISNNLDLIFKENVAWRKKESDLFPTYFSAEPIFRQTCEQLGVNGDVIHVSYEIQSQHLFQLKKKSDAVKTEDSNIPK
jgi:hypothetical protein